MYFEILDEVIQIDRIASVRSIRIMTRLRRRYGAGRRRKLQGLATVRLSSGRTRRAEIHWYEAHGVGRTVWRIKHFSN